MCECLSETLRQSSNQAISFSYMFCSRCQNHYFWWLWSECSPLPIPNREVKPHIADDTALVGFAYVPSSRHRKQAFSALDFRDSCGKVGRRQFFIREPIPVPFFCFIFGHSKKSSYFCNCLHAKCKYTRMALQ